MDRFLAIVIAAAVLAGPAPADGPAPGLWRLTTLGNTSDFCECIVKLERGDGGWTASVAAKAPFLKNTEVRVKSVAEKDGQLRLLLTKNGVESAFEGPVGSDARRILGCFGDDNRLTPAALIATDDAQLDNRNVSTRKEPVLPLRALAMVESTMGPLERKWRAAKTYDDLKAVRAEMKEKRKDIEPIVKWLHRKVLDEHADDPAAYSSAMALLRSTAQDASDAEVRAWADAAVKRATAYGPRFRQYALTQATELVGQHANHAAVTVELAKRADKEIGPNGPPAWQHTVLTQLANGLKATGAADQAKPVEAWLQTVDQRLDADAKARLPQIDAPHHPGRPAGGRAVLVELFTGAQCPPCVASDLAFEKSVEVYRPEDVVFLQYHLHIPGPDPMTNADTEERWDYYLRAWPAQVQGTPTTLFSGSPGEVINHGYGEGGGLDGAARTFNEYRKLIDVMLNEPTKAKVALKANRSGDQITMSADVSDVPSAGGPLKLRFALAEDVVRYRGGNGLLYHRRVVRAMPGGPAGQSVASPGGTFTAAVRLTDLRKDLNNYLDTFVRERGPFPKPQRPMEFARFRVVALLQDDKSFEVFQAAQVAVPEAD
jgi:hypothetical protein